MICKKLFFSCAAVLVFSAYSLIVSAAKDPIVIAHRGASGYLPEHTLESKAMAYAMGADYLEQDVVLTKDDHAIVFHDLYLDAVTDVATRFPGRARSDGKHYVIDFLLTEILSLYVHERLDLKNNQSKFPQRFPHGKGLFRVHTLADEIEMIQGLNQSTNQSVGIFVELKDPEWHKQHNKDIVAVVLKLLKEYGYTSPSTPVYIQSFDSNALKRIKHEYNSSLPLIQLIGENNWWPESAMDYTFMQTKEGLREISTYAAGIGPWFKQIYTGKNSKGHPQFTELAKHAREKGLAVFPYTLRADGLPKDISDLNELLHLLLDSQKVDGVFTDFPDAVRQFLSTR
ncbi:MAG: glycerophosphodiester phosphodiesterase [Arenicellales bacterium]|nr:glycerophosphodiester phosphodiesterase [Arenicellales bacterium]